MDCSKNHLSFFFIFFFYFFILFITLISCSPSSKDTKNKQSLLYRDHRFYLGPIEMPNEEKKWVPSLQILEPSKDLSYHSSIESLIESKARNLDQDVKFIKIIKATAWVRSKWEHYREIGENQYYVLTERHENLIGIMQMDRRFHGVYFYLEENLEKGVTLLYRFYEREFISSENSCSDGGTNSGLSDSAKLRRIYASFDEGRPARCRNNHEKDNEFIEIFLNESYQF